MDSVHAGGGPTALPAGGAGFSQSAKYQALISLKAESVAAFQSAVVAANHPLTCSLSSEPQFNRHLDLNLGWI